MVLKKSWERSPLGIADSLQKGRMVARLKGLLQTEDTGKCAEVNLVGKIPAPWVEARRMPPIMADSTTATGPFLTASMAPIMAPLVMEV